MTKKAETTYTAINHRTNTATQPSAEAALHALFEKLRLTPGAKRIERCQVWITEPGKQPRLLLDVEMDTKTGEWRRA